MVRTVSWCLLACATLVTPGRAQNSTPRSDVVGTWRLETIVDSLPGGGVSYWMGRRPTGIIMYAPSGYMSVEFMRDPRPGFQPREDSLTDAGRLAGAQPFQSLPADELRELLEGYYAYFGRYEVSAAGDSVVHFVEASLRPGEVGTTYRRAIRIDGDRLFISLDAIEDGAPRHRVLTWRRVP